LLRAIIKWFLRQQWIIRFFGIFWIVGHKRFFRLVGFQWLLGIER
jgi:hypothetical protein